MRDYYDILGVGRDASESDIKKAYRALAVQYHPDRNPDDPQAEVKFKEAADAYSVLSDEEKRTRYDQFGHDGVNGQAGAGFGNIEDIFSAFGDSVFGDLFGGSRRRGPAPGRDIRVSIKISFDDSVTGIDKSLRLSCDVRCHGCHGTGAKKGTHPTTCSTCGGQGQVVQAQGFFRVQTPCPRCRGAGKIISSPCSTCDGQQIVKKESEVIVPVPAGIDHGQTLRIPNKGHASREGGSEGRLFVDIQIREDKRFIRDEDQILTEVPISMTTAALGGRVVIPVIDTNAKPGDSVVGEEEIDVPQGTQSGKRVIRRGKGMPRIQRNSCGDQIIRFVVQTPTKLSKDAKELLKQLDKEIGGDLKSPSKRGVFW